MIGYAAAGSPLAPQGGAIGALKACRGTARFRPGPDQLAARILPLAQGTIPSDRVAWPSESRCRESNSSGGEDVPAKTS